MFKQKKIFNNSKVIKSPKSENRKIKKLDRLSLLRTVYMNLLNNGRTYAAFQEAKIFPYAEKLAGRKEILDPMSGYGSLMLYCSRLKIRAFCLEFSTPLYLWQMLKHPKYAKIFQKSIRKLLKTKEKWPKTVLIADVCNDFFHEESKRIIVDFIYLIKKTMENFKLGYNKKEELLLALLLPFVGRLSATVPGNMPTHVKRGGLCIFREFREDFSAYLNFVYNRLGDIKETTRSKQHIIKLGDCRTYIFPKKRFSAMITSPPYPNHRDFTSVFIPENELIKWLIDSKVVKLMHPKMLSIGTNVVSGRIKNPVVKNKVAKRFLHAIEEYRNPKRAKAQYDNEVYYVPYFAHYFSDLERAYENIVPALCNNFEGYINVVNNTTRDQVVPVAEVVMEIWKRLGFKSEIVYKNEAFHIGTKNPRARGFKAKHTEYIIKVWRK